MNVKTTHRSGGRLLVMGVLSILSMLAVLAPAAGAQESEPGVASDNPVFIDGGPMPGSANGMFFDADNNLWIANVFGRTITKMNPETGEILEVLGAELGIIGPDDVTVGPDGSLYWTDIVLSSVSKLTPDGELVNLVPPLGLQNANPITISEDGERLFAAGCYAESQGIFEIDPVNGGIVNTIRDGDPGCASNAMDFYDGQLWSPRVFEDRIVRVDVDTGELTDVTTGYAGPIAVKFNSEGELHAGSQGTGEVVRIDLTNPDLTANREVLATFPIGWIDNMAFDKDDRLYVSSASDGSVVEIEADGTVREVSPGLFTFPGGIGVIDDELVLGNSAQLIRFDKRSGDVLSIARSAAGFGDLPFMTSMATVGDEVIGMDLFFGELAIVDLDSASRKGSVPYVTPVDAHGYRGDVIVTSIATGDVALVSLDDPTDQTVLANVPAPTGVAGDDHDVYVASIATGQILQIIADGAVLETPTVIATDLVGPEGLTLYNGGTSLLVVESDAGRLTQVDLQTGDKSTVADGFNFVPGVAGILPFGWFNTVVTDGEAIFMNSGGDNVIHRFEICGGMTAEQAAAAGYNVIDESAATSGQTITGTAGKDWIIGSEFKDTILGKAGADVICARGGRDIVNGNWGPDMIYGGQDGDILRGGPGHDVIYGEHGWDLLFGGRGADMLNGGVGRDHLRGGRGVDTLTGGLNADRMWGGLGLDTCTDITDADKARSCRAA